MSKNEHTKQRFALKIKAQLQERGWNQSELARRAGLKRDSVSTYVCGRALPNPRSLAALARALNTRPEDLLPGAIRDVEADEASSFTLTAAQRDPNRVRVRISREVSLRAAAQIMAILSEEP
jgi:transcriptional regulator with XRE-family HTH domain